jgi:hypothetical protein
MVAASEALSLDVDFVRVDLYDIAGTPYFGELTHYPNKGLSRFDPPSLDRRLGEYLRLDDYGDDAPRVLYDPASDPPVEALEAEQEGAPEIAGRHAELVPRGPL